MKKIITFLLILIITFQASTMASAEWEIKDGERILTADSYTEDGKIKVYSLFERHFPNIRLSMELPKIDVSLPPLEFAGADGNIVKGHVTYPNRDKIIPGLFDLQWTFTPDDDKYETISGILNFEVWAEDSDISKGIIPIQNEPSDEFIATSLTATKILLDTKTAYDINLNDKVSGSKYLWSSSNTKVAKVNSKNGLVTAVSEGSTVVTCEITLPNGNKEILKSEILIGYDENSPVLTETTLDLEVGDKFDLDVENLIKKSKVKFTSSDKSVCIVKSSSGVIKAIGEGECYITCKITVKELNQVIILRCNVVITK